LWLSLDFADEDDEDEEDEEDDEGEFSCFKHRPLLLRAAVDAALYTPDR
jgi:hypothetical protein